MNSAHPAEQRLRLRTPPELKWLLNERAALAGVDAGLSEDQRLAVIQLARAEEAVLCARLRVEHLARMRSVAEQRLAALDHVVHLTNSGVNPEAGGVVKAWAGRYGERGALTAFLAETLKAAAPAPLPTSTLAQLAEENFTLRLTNASSRKNLLDTVWARLRALERNGSVERARDGGGGATSTLWRWKTAHSLSELHALIASQLGPDGDHPDANLPRGEMAGQRTGSNGG